MPKYYLKPFLGCSKTIAPSQQNSIATNGNDVGKCWLLGGIDHCFNIYLWSRAHQLLFYNIRRILFEHWMVSQISLILLNIIYSAMCLGPILEIENIKLRWSGRPCKYIVIFNSWTWFKLYRCSDDIVNGSSSHLGYGISVHLYMTYAKEPRRGMPC